MKKGFLLIFLSFLLFAVFIAFTYVVKLDLLNSFDFDTTVRLQNHIPERFDVFLSSLSLIGSFEILAGLILLMIFLRKKLISILVFIPFAAAHIIEIIGKLLLQHPGPPFMFFRYDIDFLFPSSYIQPGSSYPSGHSLRTVFVSMLLFYLIGKSKKINRYLKLFLISLLLFFNIIMLISRVSLGEHWTTDVIGGALLGISSALLSFIFL